MIIVINKLLAQNKLLISFQIYQKKYFFESMNNIISY